MYAFEQQIRVQLEFPAMSKPVEISVPWNVLRYLDLHAERRIKPDGSVIYRLPRRETVRSRMTHTSQRTAQAAA